MTHAPGSERVLPVVNGQHVIEALDEARPDQEKFRITERTWLEANAGKLAIDITRTYTAIMKEVGPSRADPLLVGMMLGHRSVRLACEGDDRLYKNGLLNHERLTEIAPPQQAVGWRVQHIPSIVFKGNDSLIAALNQIRHTDARDGASFIIANFTLGELPDLPAPAVIEEALRREGRSLDD